MSHRPRLSHHVRVLRRADDSVQIGAGTSEGIVLDHLTDEQFTYLASLDARADLPVAPQPARAAELLALLERHGLLAQRAEHHPPDIPRTRMLPRVAVEGAGSLVPALRTGLAEVGYRIVPATHPRGVSVGPGRTSMRNLAQRADLAVLVDRGGVPFLTGEPWRRSGVPHLPVVIDGPLVTVGPVIEVDGPCLRCLDLARCDRDPAWPIVLAQVAGYDATDPDEAPSTPDEIVARTLAVAVAVAAVHELAADVRYRSRGHRTSARPARATRTAHASTTWRLPGPVVERHEWQVHPRCPAHVVSATMNT